MFYKSYFDEVLFYLPNTKHDYKCKLLIHLLPPHNYNILICLNKIFKKEIEKIKTMLGVQHVISSNKPMFETLNPKQVTILIS